MLLKDNNPWVGLASYKSQDAARFFGREKESRTLAELIQANYCTILYGQSGAGKTSLIQAGVCPILSSAHYLPIPIKLDHTGTVSYARQIMERVEEEIQGIGGEIEIPVDIPEEMDDQSRAWLFFHTATFWDGQNFRITPAFFVDQFEELFTLTSDPYSVQGFFNLIDRLLQMIPPENISEAFERKNIRLPYQEKPAFRLVLSLREDFLARLEDYSYSIPALRRNRIGLAPMNGQQALEVIMNPIPGLVDRDAALRILSKVTDKEVHDDPYFLEKMTVDSCILSLFCTEIYNQAAESGRDSITQDIIDQFGNDIIQTFYERNMDGISSASVRYLESHLLTTNGFRNMVALEDMVPEHVKMEELRKLEENRIIRIETMNGTQRVEFTHDVLCKVATNHRKASNAKSERRMAVRRTVFYWFEAFLNLALVAGFLYDDELDQMDILRDAGPAVLFFAVFLLAFLLRLEHHGNRFKSPILMAGVALFGWFPMVLYIGNDCDGTSMILGTCAYALSGTVYFFVELARQRRSRNIGFLKDSFFLTKDRPRWAAALAFLLASYVIVCLFAHRIAVGTLSALLLVAFIPLLLETVCLLLPEWTDMRTRWRFGLLAEAGILLMIASQYAHSRVWYYLALLALAVSTLAFAISLKRIRIGWRIFAGLAAFALFFYIAPDYILGYHQASLGSMARTPHGTIRADSFPNMMKVNDKEGRQGVYSPALKELVLPMVYDDIRTYPRVETQSIPSAFGKSADDIVDMTFFLKKDGTNEWKESRLSREYLYNRRFSGKMRSQMEVQYSRYMEKAESILKRLVPPDTSSISSRDTSDVSVDSNELESFSSWSIYYDYFNTDIHTFLASSTNPSVSSGQAAKALIYACAANATEEFLEDGGWRHDENNVRKTLMYTVYYLCTKKTLTSFVDAYNKYLVEEGGPYLSVIDTLLLHGDDFAMRAILSSPDLLERIHDDLYWNNKGWFDLLSLRTPEVKEFLSSFAENRDNKVSNAFYSIFTGDFAQAEAYSRQAIAEDNTIPIQATAVTNLIPALFFQGKIDECKEWLDQFAYVRTNMDYIVLDALYQDLREYCRFDVFHKDTPEYDRYLGLLQSYHEDIFPELECFVSWGFLDDYPTIAFYHKGEEVTHSIHYTLYDALFFDPEGTLVSCDAIMVYGFGQDPYVMLVQGGKKGFIDNKGRSVYPVRADHAWMFSEGRAFVEEGNRLHVIDTLGRPAFERYFVDPRDYASPDFIGIDFVYHDGLAPMIDENGKMGLIDTLGNWVVRPEYDYITNPDDEGKRRYVKDKDGEESTR